MSWCRRALLFVLVWTPVVWPGGTRAQGTETDGLQRVELRFTPTERAQIALWIEQPDGTFLRTLRVTEAVSYRGIGNRPGANQMNTGFRYPYGRREGALPVWAHRRSEADGEKFPRVFFNGRWSTDGVHSGEGYASISHRRDESGAIIEYEPTNTADDYFCLSFTDSNNELDAVTCASQFRSNKGRYVTEADVASEQAAEPWQDTDGNKHWRPLDTGSIYPPRRDLGSGIESSDHADVAEYATDAREVMPNIDAVTMATLPGNEPHIVQFTVPADWPDGDYVALLEVHVEADYNDAFNPDIYGPPDPDPDSGDEYWDSWSHTKGIPYRGQPSVVYRVPFTVRPSGGAWFADTPQGFGKMHGLEGQMTSMPDARITDDPASAPGSGADRLRMRADGTRLTVLVKPTDVCAGEDPHPECGKPCTMPEDCIDERVDCGDDNVCVDYCHESFDGPPSVLELDVLQHEDEKHSHEWATLGFEVPASARPITRYQVKYGTDSPPTDPARMEGWFESLLQAKAPRIESEMLQIVEIDPATGEPMPFAAGERVTVDAGQLNPQTRYHFAVRPVDACGRAGPIATAEVVTTQIHFETVSPCFVATAAYGSPLAAEVGVLRRLRDRHLRPSAPGRALVGVYHAVGPQAARLISDRPWLRAATRAWLRPIVSIARLLTD